MAAVAIIGLLASSTGVAVLRKVLFQMDAPGLHHHVHHFEKPYFTSWESGVALAICLPLYWLSFLFQRARSKPTRNTAQSSDLEQPLLSKKEEGMSRSVSQKSFKTWILQFLALSVPGILNNISLIVNGIGLQFVPATVNLMLSGATVLFTAVLSVIFLKCRLNVYHIIGIILTLLGVVVVGGAGILFPSVENHDSDSNQSTLNWSALHQTPSGSTGNEVLGITLSVLAAFFLAGRLIADEVALEGTDLHPFQVLGYEGIWGVVISSLAVYPFAWFLPGRDEGGRAENVVDTLVMLADRDLSIANALFFLSVVGMNVFGLLVTRRLGSVFRAVLLTARTASVWGVDLILFYTHFKGGQVGEAWMTPSSYIQLAGFILVLVGTIIYAQGSSEVALLLSNTKPSLSTALTGPSRLTMSNASTQLRPLTSLYIPNVPVRRSNLQAAGSVPNDAVWPHQRGGFHLTNSVPNNFGLAMESGEHVGTVLDDAPAPSGSQLTPHSSDLPITIHGASPQSMSSGQFFLQTLTHRSSWMLSDAGPPGPQLESRGSQISRSPESGPFRTDPSFDADASTRPPVSIQGYGSRPASSVFGDAENNSVGSFTFATDQSSPRSNLAPVSSAPDRSQPSQGSGLPTLAEKQGHVDDLAEEEGPESSGVRLTLSQQPGQSDAVKLGFDPIFSLGSRQSNGHQGSEQEKESGRIGSGDNEAEGRVSAKTAGKADAQPTQSEGRGISADTGSHGTSGKLATYLSGDESDTSNQSSGSRHVYGQSPTPEVLQQRRSAIKSPRQPLAALTEADTFEGEEEGDDGEEFEDALAETDQESDSDKEEDEWQNLDSHHILFADSDSDISLGSDGALSGRKSSDKTRRSGDRRSSLSMQGSRSLQDVDPAQFRDR